MCFNKYAYIKKKKKKKGQCLTNNVVYQATTTDLTTETYVQLATNFKERYRRHAASFPNHKKKKTTLNYPNTFGPSKLPRTLQSEMENTKEIKPNNNISNKCNLCLSENFFIICQKELPVCSLNKCNELASSCPHRTGLYSRTL